MKAKGSIRVARSFQTEDIAHVVNARSLLDNPLRSAQGARRECFTTGGFVRQFETFTQAGHDHRVVSYDITPSKRMHADFAIGSFARDAFTSVFLMDSLAKLNLTDFRQNPGEGVGGAAGRVLLVPVVHLDDLQVEAGTEDLGGLARQPEKSVHPC